MWLWSPLIEHLATCENILWIFLPPFVPNIEQWKQTSFWIAYWSCYCHIGCSSHFFIFLRSIIYIPVYSGNWSYENMRAIYPKILSFMLRVYSVRHEKQHFVFLAEFLITAWPSTTPKTIHVSCHVACLLFASLPVCTTGAGSLSYGRWDLAHFLTPAIWA